MDLTDNKSCCKRRITQDGIVISLSIHGDYTAWEPSRGHTGPMLWRAAAGPNTCYGVVASRPIPDEIRELPRGMERARGINAWRDDLFETCYRAITEVFPEAATGDRFAGEIYPTETV